MTIKQLILEEIEGMSEVKLTTILDFIRASKQQFNIEKNKQETIEKIEKDSLNNSQVNSNSIPTIAEMLNQLTKIQQENPVYLESIERCDRINSIISDK